MGSWEQLIENFDKRLDHEEIDDFLVHLNESVGRRIKALEDESSNLSSENFEDPRDIDAYKSHLDELIGSSYSAKMLGDELSIIALYKKVEIHTGNVIKRKIPSASSKNLSYFKELCKVVPYIKTVDGYSAFNELRLINNSIKHGGKVSSELADNFSCWKENDEISGLEDAFKRLLPKVKQYVRNLVEKIYADKP